MEEVLTKHDIELTEECPCAWGIEHNEGENPCRGTKRCPSDFGRAVLEFVALYAVTGAGK